MRFRYVRNLTDLWPEALSAAFHLRLVPVLRPIAGDHVGLIRAILFDKPPSRSWGLPWHKDVMIPVRDATRPSTRFRSPSMKSRVPHVEAPVEVLQRMITVRIHLDAPTLENGCLYVAPGSHRTGKALKATDREVAIVGDAGDALIMQPLLAHRSPRSSVSTASHRRVLHFEYSMDPTTDTSGSSSGRWNSLSSLFRALSPV